jgi:hypothetical protein
LVSSYVQAGYLLRVSDGWGQRTEWTGVGDALVGPVLVVEVLELAQGVKQVTLVPDQRPVEQFSAAGLHPAFHDRVHAGHSDASEHDLVPGVLQDSVEQLGVLAAPVQHLDLCDLVEIVELHPRRV